MTKEYDINKLDQHIREIISATDCIEELAGDIEAVKKNLVRLKASVKMLQLNISDVKFIST